MNYFFTLGNNQVQILYSNAKRGEYIDSMRVDQYGRPSDVPIYQRFGTDNNESCKSCVGTVESKQLIQCQLITSCKRVLMFMCSIAM